MWTSISGVKVHQGKQKQDHSEEEPVAARIKSEQTGSRTRLDPDQVPQPQNDTKYSHYEF